jgi:8-oxo-dGTP pyrophosphatase MutT (NUDIX family)
MKPNTFLARASGMSELAHAPEYEAKRAAGAIILAWDTKKILIGQRGIMGDFPMVWGTIGGCLEEGEGPRTACRREIMEETGYSDRMRLIPLMECSEPGKDFIYYNFLAIVPWEFEPVKDEENNAFRWINFNEWPEPLHPGFEKLLNNKISMTTVMKHVYALHKE